MESLATKVNLSCPAIEMSSIQEYGENLYCSWSSNPKAKCAGSKPVESWYSEMTKYTFGSEPTSSASGEYPILCTFYHPLQLSQWVHNSFAVVFEFSFFVKFIPLKFGTFKYELRWNLTTFIWTFSNIEQLILNDTVKFGIISCENVAV